MSNLPYSGRVYRLTHPMMHGDPVRSIQQQLNNYGYGLKVDGWYGPLTDTVVRRFQAAHGLAADGAVGPLTWGALWPGEPLAGGDKYGKVRDKALMTVGRPYIYGVELRLSDLNPQGARDCSENNQWIFYQAISKDVGDPSTVQERTFSERIGQPDRPGDVFFMGAVGRSTHTGIYIGNGQVVEARNHIVGTVLSTVADINRRGGWWRRMPNW